MTETLVKALIDDISRANEMLQNFSQKLENEKVTPQTYRDFKDITDYFHDLKIDTEDLEQEVKEVEDLVTEYKNNAVQRVIDELEEREKDYGNISDQDLRKRLSYFKGYALLDEYLNNLTKESDYPISHGQVANYVWELIAIDVIKFKRKQKNVLNLWSSKLPYSRYMMLED